MSRGGQGPHEKRVVRGAVTEAVVERQARMLADRVRKTYARWRRAFERDSVGAFRLYDRDIPEVRLVVDWYEGHVVVAEYERAQTAAVPDWLRRMGQAVATGLSIPSDHVHLKRRRTRPTAGPRYSRLGRRGQELVVREGPLRFVVNLDDHIDTGLFADHRETRRMVRREAADRRFLNLFGYTGSFSCAAAVAGAATTTVDLSPSYLAWAERNFLLNEVDPGAHQFVAGDVGTFLREQHRAGRCWDVVVCDPPSFSTRGGPNGRWDVVRHHPWLIDLVLQVTVSGGVVIFSTNHQRFESRLHSLTVRECSETTAKTVPPDFRNRGVHRTWRLVR